MYVVFLKFIFVENFNTSSQSYQPIPWNCNDKIWRAEGRHMGPKAEGQKNKYPSRSTIYCEIACPHWYIQTKAFLELYMQLLLMRTKK